MGDILFAKPHPSLKDLVCLEFAVMASTTPPCPSRAEFLEPGGGGDKHELPQWNECWTSPPVLFAAGDEDEDESGEERLPSCFDYVMHFLTVFWKVLFACVPPTEYCNGWACFIVSILIIGMLTAVIGDLASHFGCTIGLKDSVTAVVFVAFGTSVPGGVAVGRGGVGVGGKSSGDAPDFRGESLTWDGVQAGKGILKALYPVILGSLSLGGDWSVSEPGWYHT